MRSCFVCSVVIKDLLKLVKKYEMSVTKTNAEIMIEINKCRVEIYKIDQSFIQYKNKKLY